MPDTFLTDFQDIIACSVPMTRERENGSTTNQVILTEVSPQDGAIVSQITIRDLPDDTLVFKVDAFPAPHNFFNDVNGVRKRADYVLLAQKADKKRAGTTAFSNATLISLEVSSSTM